MLGAPVQLAFLRNLRSSPRMRGGERRMWVRTRLSITLRAYSIVKQPCGVR